MRAKFRCASVEEIHCNRWDDVAKKYTDEKDKAAEVVRFHAVYSPSADDPNHAWAKSTPAGSLQMQIDNPAAWGHFKPDCEYFLDFAEVPAAT